MNSAARSIGMSVWLGLLAVAGPMVLPFTAAAVGQHKFRGLLLIVLVFLIFVSMMSLISRPDISSGRF